MRTIVAIIGLGVILGVILFYRQPIATKIASLRNPTPTPVAVLVDSGATLVTPTPKPATPTPTPVTSIAKIQATPTPVATDGKLPTSGPEDFLAPLALGGGLTSLSTYYLSRRRSLRRQIRSIFIV